MNQKEFDEILDKHKKWLFGEEGGIRADLYGANLSWAYLGGADLREADMRGAYLGGADLRGADLRGADLRGADLVGADLVGADLSEADLYGANLSGANMSEAKNTDECLWSITTTFFPLQCPESGSFIGWKTANGFIVKLRITENAKRSSATSRKCRCSEAEVLAIENEDGSNSGISFACSDYDVDFVYQIGETVRVDNFDENRWNECAPGIHFFITREEAVKYGK